MKSAKLFFYSEIGFRKILDNKNNNLEPAGLDFRKKCSATEFTIFLDFLYKYVYIGVVYLNGERYVSTNQEIRQV